MITVASGYQYSVNINFDLNNDDKLRNFIPTRSSLKLLEDILRSTDINSTERARILIGAYGKGKSHIVLTILSILLGKDRSLFEILNQKIKDRPDLIQAIDHYYSSGNKLLPVIISGSNTSLSQSFILALERSLSENDLWDIMPETNYKAAINVIDRWQENYPDIFSKFSEAIAMPVQEFKNDLEQYDLAAYNTFEQIYPSLTGGSTFNPFLGFDVIDLYESVAKSIKQRGYSGIYIIYDEFSKYLESNIISTPVSDVKMLQDFAEKCNRSHENQMHIMLISHKEIANYIDILPKQKTDGWRGVSERFLHVHLNNNFAQTYEIISAVIKKEPVLWPEFTQKHQSDFESLFHRYSKHPIFSDVSSDGINQIIYDCYPLHPVSTFILPRLSERIAQNERTLFTFLSADGNSTLPSFLKNHEGDCFDVITPDIIYDYFEPLLRKEIYSGNLHSTYILATQILENFDQNSLESKIIKTISLIYILEQYEKIQPSIDELIGIFSTQYSSEEIKQAVTNLADKEFVIYLKRSNSFLKLKQSSGVNIKEQISNLVSSFESSISVRDILNNANLDYYMYPSRYNDEKDMTRFFAFRFIDAQEAASDTNWSIKSENIIADGVIYAILPDETESISALEYRILLSSKNHERFIFILPKKYVNIKSTVLEFEAVKQLREKAADDKTLFDEYEVIYEDLLEIITTFIHNYTHPETYKSIFIQNGTRHVISRKSGLTNLMSQICEQVYCFTPEIHNEAINKNEITSMAANSRTKIITGLLRSETEKDLGLVGSGQDVSIMRSTLLRAGILVNNDTIPQINLHPADKAMEITISTIVDFINSSKNTKNVCFSKVYDSLILPEGKIGLRRGLIPIYLAAVIHEFKQQIIISTGDKQVPISTDTLLQIDANPKLFYLSYFGWDSAKEEYVSGIEDIFSDFIISAEKTISSYDYVVTAMRRWYLSLPKYVRESQKEVSGERIEKKNLMFLKQIKNNNNVQELLFVRIPELFDGSINDGIHLLESIKQTKIFYDSYLDYIKNHLVQFVTAVFTQENGNADGLIKSLKNWSEKLDPSVFTQLFTNGTEKFLSLIITQGEYISDNAFISKLARITTGLNINDWNDSTISTFQEKILLYKETAEGFIGAETIGDVEKDPDSYQVTFIDADGNPTVKRFEKVEITNRGKLLLNAINAEIDSMGNAIPESEKRQILMDVLKNIC